MCVCIYMYIYTYAFGWIVHHQLATREEIAERVAAAASRCSFAASLKPGVRKSEREI